MCPILKRTEMVQAAYGAASHPNEASLQTAFSKIISVVSVQEICSGRSVSVHSYPGWEDSPHHWGQHRDWEGDRPGSGNAR